MIYLLHSADDCGDLRDFDHEVRKQEAVDTRNGKAGFQVRWSSELQVPLPTDMPSDQSTWLVAIPQDGDSEGLFLELKGKLFHQSRSAGNNIAELSIPSFKVTSTFPI